MTQILVGLPHFSPLTCVHPGLQPTPGIPGPWHVEPTCLECLVTLTHPWRPNANGTFIQMCWLSHSFIDSSEMLLNACHQLGNVLQMNSSIPPAGFSNHLIFMVIPHWVLMLWAAPWYRTTPKTHWKSCYGTRKTESARPMQKKPVTDTEVVEDRRCFLQSTKQELVSCHWILRLPEGLGVNVLMCWSCGSSHAQVPGWTAMFVTLLQLAILCPLENFNDDRVGFRQSGSHAEVAVTFCSGPGVPGKGTPHYKTEHPDIQVIYFSNS